MMQIVTAHKWYLLERHSLSSRRLMPVVHYISPIQPVYGLARDRAASLHTIGSDDNYVVEKFYETWALHNRIMYFVPWFITTYLPFYINVIEQTYKDGSGNLLKSIYPPQSSRASSLDKADMAKANPVLTTDIASTSKRKPTVISTHVQRPLEIQDFKFGSVKELEELLDKKFLI
ncbi:hypothetical protein H5410_041301 [Solanum commersonii]|uniref:Uncharacterized protein n=1 Tax=Solanum commersonii TaxID=4109 RepID=A0A9J5XR71_SOLCO|nr:hypothetical protein H5410_041301 [Solanum commersonii]